MTECARCGDCCDPVHLTVSPADITAMRETKMAVYGARTTSLRTLAWMRDLQLVGRRWNGRRMVFLYRCPHFTAERTCGAYSQRPSTCSRYPWYDGEPVRGDTTMGGRCSFLGDVYPMLPIVEVRHSAAAGASSAA